MGLLHRRRHAAGTRGVPVDEPRLRITIPVDDTKTVSGIFQIPPQAFCCYVMAHGAGAGMTHAFMAAVAEGLYRRDIATLRFQFPYMENAMIRPDRPALAHATIRAAVKAAGTRLPLFAGGKSFGARMTSQAQAEAPLPNVQGLIFFGFPLHAAKKPSVERASHLSGVTIPMLFLQGTRDALADIDLLGPIIEKLPRALLKPVPHADHSFHVPLRSGLTDEQVLNELLDTATSWMRDFKAQ